MGETEPFRRRIEQSRLQARDRLVDQIVYRVDNVIYERLASRQRYSWLQGVGPESQVAGCRLRVQQQVNAYRSRSSYQGCVTEVLGEQGGRRIIHREKIGLLGWA